MLTTHLLSPEAIEIKSVYVLASDIDQHVYHLTQGKIQP